MHERCWYRQCPDRGELRPLFARSRELPLTLRLCERHLSELSRRDDAVAQLLDEPARASDR